VFCSIAQGAQPVCRPLGFYFLTHPFSDQILVFTAIRMHLDRKSNEVRHDSLIDRGIFRIARYCTLRAACWIAR